MPQLIKLRVRNPRTKKSFSVRRRKRNWLGGGGELALMTNPKKRRNRRSYAKKANPFKRYRRRVKRNPAMFRRRRHRNPEIAGASISDLFQVGLSAAGGAYGTRALTQMLLQANNTGWMGYGANVLVAIALAWGAAKVLGNKVGLGVAAGGIAGVALRIWSEQVSNTSPAALSGMGDLDFSTSGMGDYVQTSYALPSQSVKNASGQWVIANPWPPALPAAPATAPAGKKGMGFVGASPRFHSRFK